MTSSEQRIQYLLQAFVSKTITPQDEQEFWNWMHEAEDDTPLRNFILEEWQGHTAKQTSSHIDWDGMYNNILQLAARQAPIRKIYTWIRWAVAASILLVIGLSSYFLFFNKPAEQNTFVEIPPIDIAPGTNKAILTLADGRQIILDSAQNGNVAEQGTVTVIKLDGQLSYNDSKLQTLNSQLIYNTVTVPRKGQYQLVLSDGTKVWLDAESSLRYPTSFPGAERTVELTGQGYFEVAQNAAKPFHVKTATQDVAVLGTHFNINSYANEDAVKTTLIEGSVSVIARSDAGATKQSPQSVRLKPGQESQLNKAGAISLIKNADTEQALAWKNGQFSFKSASLRSIMNQLVRWYDVEVVYEGNQSVSLSGYVDRNVPLSQTLKLLESNGVRLRQEGRKIIMMQ